ncbi:MAG: vancomycin resistance protein [Firmicutes bacterium HGW-Firmicutes-16]|nr:MAG: vancomycin resistance protein [Firmicutes bacterium HGW-Firmicutes-16]
MAENELRTIPRTKLRLILGKLYYSELRYALWLKKRSSFARKRSDERLPFVHFHHETILLRQLKDVDMQYQYNKIINLKLAAKKLNGIVVHPGEVLSYWKLIGRPSARKGYVKGMVLTGGKVSPGIGGGLCQMSNLIYWMTLHTPLTVIERHHHGYDVFPDNNRTQPFGSGATCYYPYGDLMIYNGTNSDFQLSVRVGEIHLEGEWRGTIPPEFRYEIEQREHEMRGERFGGFSRHNKLYRVVTDMDGNFVREDFVVENHAMMMYSPFLPDAAAKK